MLPVVQRQFRSAAAASPVRQEQNFDPARSTLVLPAATSSRTAQQLQALRNSLQIQRRRRTSRFQQEQSYDPARSQMVLRSDSEQPERRVEDVEYVYNVFHRVDLGPSQLQEASCRPQRGSDTSQAGRADTEASHSPSSPAAPPRPDRLVDLPVALLRSRGSVDGASCAAARGGSPFADPKTAAAVMEEVGPPYPAELVFVIV